MKYQLVSDVHLHGRQRAGEVAQTDAKALLLAGDVIEWHNAMDRKVGKEFLFEMAGRYERVYYIPGNHEYYGGRMDKAYQLMKDACEETGVIFAHNQYLDMGDHVLVAHTLWTNMNNDDPLAKLTVKRGMNDFNYIFQPDGAMFAPEDAMIHFAQGMRVIRDAVKYADMLRLPVLVMTHHAPHAACLHPHFANAGAINYGYFTNLEPFLLDNPQIKAWVHGHVHYANDQMLGDCRVMCNPLGYAGYREGENYKPDFTFNFPA